MNSFNAFFSIKAKIDQTPAERLIFFFHILIWVEKKFNVLIIQVKQNFSIRTRKNRWKPAIFVVFISCSLPIMGIVISCLVCFLIKKSLDCDWNFATEDVGNQLRYIFSNCSITVVSLSQFKCK